MKRRNDEFVLFQTEDRKIALDVRFEEETVWLSLDQMADLFDRNKSTISRHIKNLKFLGYGLIVFGISTLLIDITDGFSHHYKSYDLTPPFFYVLSGLILIFIKEIFVKARKIQEENDLTI
mgnify:CR=1 FL=1